MNVLKEITLDLHASKTPKVVKINDMYSRMYCGKKWVMWYISTIFLFIEDIDLQGCDLGIRSQLRSQIVYIYRDLGSQ